MFIKAFHEQEIHDGSSLALDGFTPDENALKEYALEKMIKNNLTCGWVIVNVESNYYKISIK